MDISFIIEKLDFSSLMWEISVPLIFSLADIITGYLQAVINKNVDSQKMRVGLLHKCLIIIVVILSFVIEFAFNIPYVSKVVCIYVFLMETISILENLKKAGIDLGRLANILKDKSELTTSETISNLADKIEDAIKEKED